MDKRKRGNKILGAILNVTPKRFKPTVTKRIKAISSRVEQGKKTVNNQVHKITYGKKRK